MGAFHVPVVITAMDGGQSVEIEMVAGTHARFSTAPGHLLRSLGIEPSDKRSFRVGADAYKELAEGRVWMAIGDCSAPTVIGFDDDDAPALIGSHTLTAMMLDADTDAEQIVPARLVMRQVPSVVPHPSPRYDFP